MAKIVHKTVEELRAEAAAILAEYPKLATVDPSEFCCSGCVQHDIAEAWGWDAADAWERLQSVYFLMDGHK